MPPEPPDRERKQHVAGADERERRGNAAVIEEDEGRGEDPTAAPRVLSPYRSPIGALRVSSVEMKQLKIRGRVPPIRMHGGSRNSPHATMTGMRKPSASAIELLGQVPEHGGERREDMIAGDDIGSEHQLDECEHRKRPGPPPTEHHGAHTQAKQEGRRDDGGGDGIAAEVVLEKPFHTTWYTRLQKPANPTMSRLSARATRSFPVIMARGEAPSQRAVKREYELTAHQAHWVRSPGMIWIAPTRAVACPASRVIARRSPRRPRIVASLRHTASVTPLIDLDRR